MWERGRESGFPHEDRCERESLRLVNVWGSPFHVVLPVYDLHVVILQPQVREAKSAKGRASRA